MSEPRDESRWQSLWMAADAPADRAARTLATRARAEARWMRVAAVVESIVSLVLLSLIGHVMLEHTDALHVVWGSAASAIILTAWLFLALNRRGLWRPFVATTEGFLRNLSERYRRRLRTTRFISLLATIHLLFTGGLVWWSLWGRSERGLHPADAAAYASSVAIFVGVVVWSRWLGGRARARLAELEELRGTIEQG